MRSRSSYEHDRRRRRLTAPVVAFDRGLGGRRHRQNGDIGPVAESGRRIFPDELADQAASHGPEAVQWAVGTLSHDEAKRLLGKLSRNSIDALRDVPASEASLRSDRFGRETLEKVAAPLGGRRLATEVELAGPDTARDMVEGAARTGKFDKLRRHADNLEAARAEISAARALEGGSLVVDSQVMIAVRKLMAGDSWNGLSEKRGDGQLAAHAGGDGSLNGDPPARDLASVIGEQDLRAGNVGLGEIGTGTHVGGLDLSVSRTDPIYIDMLAELSKGDPVGGPSGAADRAVVADAVLARNNGKDLPTLMTGDHNIFKPLAKRYVPGLFKQRVVDGKTERIEETIRRDGAKGFIVNIPDRNGALHPLKVIPIYRSCPMSYSYFVTELQRPACGAPVETSIVTKVESEPGTVIRVETGST